MDGTLDFYGSSQRNLALILFLRFNQQHEFDLMDSFYAR